MNHTTTCTMPLSPTLFALRIIFNIQTNQVLKLILIHIHSTIRMIFAIDTITVANICRRPNSATNTNLTISSQSIVTRTESTYQ